MNKRYGIRLLSCITCRIAAVLLCAAAGMASGCSRVSDMRNYLKAVEYYENGDFENACRYFNLADGYGNSEEYLSVIAEYEELYIEAVDSMHAHDYEYALSIFNSIPGYMNAKEQSEYINSLKANFEAGVEKYEAMDYAAARECFIRADGYASSGSYIENIDNMDMLYNEALRFADAGLYGEAINALRRINTDYCGAYALIDELYEKLSVQPVTLKGYIAAYRESWRLSGRETDAPVSYPAEDEFTLSDGDIVINGKIDAAGAILELTMLLPAGYSQAAADEAAAHFIHALNTRYMDYSAVAASLDDYLEGRADYCGARISLTRDDGGMVRVCLKKQASHTRQYQSVLP